VEAHGECEGRWGGGGFGVCGSALVRRAANCRMRIWGGREQLYLRYATLARVILWRHIDRVGGDSRSSTSSNVLVHCETCGVCVPSRRSGEEGRQGSASFPPRSFSLVCAPLPVARLVPVLTG
jgi:hypothetical protein